MRRATTGLDVPQGKQVRLEFTGIPEGYFPVSGHSRTQFVTSPGEASLGVYAHAQGDVKDLK